MTYEGFWFFSYLSKVWRGIVRGHRERIIDRVIVELNFLQNLLWQIHAKCVTFDALHRWNVFGFLFFNGNLLHRALMEKWFPDVCTKINICGIFHMQKLSFCIFFLPFMLSSKNIFFLPPRRFQHLTLDNPKNIFFAKLFTFIF